MPRGEQNWITRLSWPVISQLSFLITKWSLQMWLLPLIRAKASNHVFVLETLAGVW